MKGLLKFLLKTAKILCYVILVLFVVYFWNMDQKLMAWLYKVVHTIFDQKKVEKIL